MEVIVCDDQSTDKTSSKIEIFCSNINRKDIKFKHFRHRKNIGMVANFQFALKQCTGQYIAFCEGDDFWTEDKKIYSQIEIMETGYDATFHDCIVVDEFGSQKQHKFSKGRPIIDRRISGEIKIHDLIGSPIRNWHLAAVMIKKDFLISDLVWMQGFPVADFPFLAVSMSRCRIYYDATAQAAYRKNSSSVTHGRRHDISYARRIDKMLCQTRLRLPHNLHGAIFHRRLGNIVSALHFYGGKSALLYFILLPALLLMLPWNTYSFRDLMWLSKRKLAKKFSES